MRTIKEGVVWINEFSNFQEAYEPLGDWIELDYNKLYVHSALGYLGPEEFEQSLANRHCQAVVQPILHFSTDLADNPRAFYPF